MWFTPRVRCCTYEPALPNYVVGRILRDDDPALAFGRETVLNRLQHRPADATPWGMLPSARFRTLYRSGKDLFGRAPDLACPHLQPGDSGCGIWRHRPIVCASWHCKHDRGAVGHAVWRAVDQAVREIELTLGIWCLHESGVGASAVRQALQQGDREVQADQLGGALNTAEYGALWGDWVGREQEFYRRCAELVDALAWADILRLGGARLQALVGVARDAQARLADPALPERLTLGAVSLQPGAPGTVRLETYSPFNPLQVPEVLVQILPRFAGGRTQETLHDIERDHQLRLNNDLVRTLVDFGVLHAVGPDAPPERTA